MEIQNIEINIIKRRKQWRHSKFRAQSRKQNREGVYPGLELFCRKNR
jgi:hypothetical protein